MTCKGLMQLIANEKKGCVAMYIRHYDLCNQLLCSKQHPPGFKITDHVIEKTHSITQIKTMWIWVPNPQNFTQITYTSIQPLLPPYQYVCL